MMGVMENFYLAFSGIDMKVSRTSGAKLCFFFFSSFFLLHLNPSSVCPFLAMRAHHKHGGAVKPCTLFSLFST